MVQIWELGGSAAVSTDLIDIPLASSQHVDKCTLVIVLDLSQPQYIWEVFEIALEKAKEYVKFIDTSYILTLTLISPSFLISILVLTLDFFYW